MKEDETQEHLGRGIKERGCAALEFLCSFELVIWMELLTPFFIEGPPLDLIKVSLGYAAMFEMDMHHGPFMSRTVALQREALLCIGAYPSTFS